MRVLLALFSVLALIAAGAAVTIGLAVKTYLADGPLMEEKAVMIERGSGVAAIADTLEREGVIADALIFKIAARLTDNQGTFKAGEYEFLPAMAMAEVMDKIRKGEVIDRVITVPEGMTSWQIVQRLTANDHLTGEIAAIPSEGSLLPETYHYTRGDTRAAKIAEMQAAMTRTMDELWEKRADNLPFATREEALVLASIVEKETGVASERRRIAGVFVNRLRARMPLQTDPTVIYALTRGAVKDEGQGPLGRRLLTKDLQTDSPYNTYKYPGLPPGPIANPGRAAIEAALNPEAHEYIYFVADGTGGHAFAKTLAEHNANVAKWRKIRAAQ